MPIYATAPVMITFLDTSSSLATAWLWTFGDGATANTQNATHVYTVAGTYPVSLTITTVYGVATIFDSVVIDGASIAWTPPSPARVAVSVEDPRVMLRLSNDAGRTWITEQIRTVGKSGEFDRRVRWNRLGMGRRRVFEVSMSDPIPWKITGAFLAVVPAQATKVGAS